MFFYSKMNMFNNKQHDCSLFSAQENKLFPKTIIASQKKITKIKR